MTTLVTVARTKTAWEERFGRLLMTGRVPRDLAHVIVRPKLQFVTAGRRDSDNFYFAISKPLGDALVKGGWLPDDDPAHYACERPRIETGVKCLPPLARGRLTLEIEYETASPSPAR